MAKKGIYSIAFVIGEKDKNLYGKRNESYCRDYKNFWSLPSSSVSEEEYTDVITNGKLPKEIITKLIDKTGYEIVKWHLLIYGEREKEDYHLYQAVCQVDVFVKKCVPVIEKYTDLEFLSPAEVLDKQKKMVGTCISLYFTFLIRNGVECSTFRYYEVDSKYAEGLLNLEKQSAQTLWKDASQNYGLLKLHRTGTEGESVREFTLNRYVDNLLKNIVDNKMSFMDVGCGNGQIVEYLVKQKIDAWGLEIGNAVLASIRDRVFDGDMMNMDILVGEKRYDCILANLLFEWIEDLKEALEILRRHLTKNGVVYASFTPPEYQRAGNWIRNNDICYSWEQTKCAKRDRELVMINRCVGPLWFYPRSIADISNCIYEAGLAINRIEDIYVDSYLELDEVEEIKAQYPYLFKQKIIPLFTVFEIGVREC